MKKKIWLATLFCGVVVCVLVLVGCQGKTSDDPDYQDEAFLADLGKGLNNRWDLSDRFDQESDASLTAEQFEQLVQCELDSIEKYANEKFEDSELRELAVSYVNVLHEQQEASDLYASTSLDVDAINEWNSVYNERASILKEILDNYEVKTDEKHESTRSQLMTDGRNAQKAANVEAALQNIAGGIQFVFANDGWGNITGTATVTNNTGMNFETAQFDIQLYDEAGVRTETTYASVENWNDGEAVNIDIYVGNAGSPASVKVVPSYWSLQN